MKKIKLSKKDKILLTILDLSGESKEKLKFEDVVVGIFKKFPDDFHLKGYKEYPDADSIRRPLYKLRDEGILLVRNMIFSFTDKGLDEALNVSNKISNKKIDRDNKFDRYIEKEIKRVISTRSFMLFGQEKEDDILDTDFFDYLGTSVKSDRVDFKARLDVMREVNSAISYLKKEPYITLSRLYDYMIDKFSEDIAFKIKH